MWDKVADRAKPLHPQQSKPDNISQPKEQKKSKQPTPGFRVGQTTSGARPHDILPDVTARLAGAPVQMDHKSFGKMKRGKLVPEARIDLHGMTMAEAHPELLAFILGSQSVGRRLVLVITGKGKDRDTGGPIPARHGVLRHQVPQWLALPPLSQAVLQVTPAHIKHGGHGAYYVYLRRRR